MSTSCCLFLAGDDDASWGIYTPVSYRIKPVGNELMQHHVMHLHEIHHKALNDDTAWGALIHIAARHPDWQRDVLPLLVGCCRTVHESLASFMSLSLSRTRHAAVESALNAYPVYRPLAARMARLLAPVPASHRKDLAATGVARWCMSPPIIEHAAAIYPRRITLAEIPAGMRPDHRFRMIMMLTDHDISCAVQAADSAFNGASGQLVDTLTLDATDDSLDSAWAAWEDAFITAVVTGAPTLARLPTTGPNEHLSAAAELIELAAGAGHAIELPHQIDERPLSDVESVQRLVSAMSLELRDPPYRAALLTPGEHVELDAVLGLRAASTVPNLVVDGRRTHDLARSFRFGEQDRARLAELDPGPVFAIRCLVDDKGEDLLLHTEVDTPQLLAKVKADWQPHDVYGLCITASCFLDTDWQLSWGPALRQWPTVVLADMGLATMVGAGRLLGTTEAVNGAYLGLGRVDIGGVVWHVAGHPHVMLALGDDLTVQLLVGQLEDLLGDRLTMDEADWSQWDDVLSAIAANVLATEPNLSYDGGGAGPGISSQGEIAPGRDAHDGR